MSQQLEAQAQFPGSVPSQHMAAPADLIPSSGFCGLSHACYTYVQPHTCKIKINKCLIYIHICTYMHIWNNAIHLIKCFLEAIFL